MYPRDLPIPEFDRAEMKRILKLKIKADNEPNDEMVDAVVYEIIVTHVKNRKQLVLGFTYERDRCVPILSEPIENIKELWENKHLNRLYEIKIMPKKRVIVIK